MTALAIRAIVSSVMYLVILWFEAAVMRRRQNNPACRKFMHLE